MVRSPFGHKMRALREALDPPMSLRQFAINIGYSAAYVSDMERGLRLPPGDEKVAEIEKVLHTTPNSLRKLAQRERIGIKYAELSESAIAKIAEIMEKEGVKV